MLKLGRKLNANKSASQLIKTQLRRNIQLFSQLENKIQARFSWAPNPKKGAFSEKAGDSKLSAKSSENLPKFKDSFSSTFF